MGKIGLTPSATGSNDSPKTTTGKTTTGGAGGAYAKMFENNRPARPVKVSVKEMYEVGLSVSKKYI